MKWICKNCDWKGTPMFVGRWIVDRKTGDARFNGRCCPKCGEPLIGFDAVKDLKRTRIVSPNKKDPIGILARCDKGHEKEVLFDGDMINVGMIWMKPEALVLPECCRSTIGLAVNFMRKQYEAGK